MVGAAWEPPGRKLLKISWTENGVLPEAERSEAEARYLDTGLSIPESVTGPFKGSRIPLTVEDPLVTP
jgi:hypothetical protein